MTKQKIKPPKSSEKIRELMATIFEDEPQSLMLEQDYFEQIIKEIPQENRITYDEYCKQTRKQ